MFSEQIRIGLDYNGNSDNPFGYELTSIIYKGTSIYIKIKDFELIRIGDNVNKIKKHQFS